MAATKHLQQNPKQPSKHSLISNPQVAYQDSWAISLSSSLPKAQFAPELLSHDEIALLQRSIDNQSMNRLLRTSTNQLKDPTINRLMRQSHVAQQDELSEIKKRYGARTKIYQEYYKNPKYKRQENIFGKHIIGVLDEIRKRLEHFGNKKWIDSISDFLQKRWFIGIKGAPAFKAKYGESALRKYQDVTSTKMWEQALLAAQHAEKDPHRYDTNEKQERAISKFPKDVQQAYGELSLGNPVFEDDKEYVTYLQTIAHDYIDLSDAMVECGCGSEKDWKLLIDILTDVSAGQDELAWIGDVTGIADESLENYITLTMKRAVLMSAKKNKEKLVCPKID